MTTAFVLSGGGSLGAVQVGMLAALDEADIRPDLLVGTSVGALNAAFIGSHGFDTGTVDDLAQVWNGLSRSDVFPVAPLRQALALAGRKRSMVSSSRLRHLIDQHLSVQGLADGPIPVHVVTTDVMSGEEVLLSTGDAASAVLASASIPAVFPPVEREGRTLMDGGVSNNTAISQAIASGADRIIVLPAGFACALTEAPSRPLDAAIHALTLLIEQRLCVEVGRLSDRAEIIVLPPLCPLSVSPVDFSKSADLIARGHRTSGEWLASKAYETPHPEQVLSLHSHQFGTRSNVSAPTEVGKQPTITTTPETRQS